MRRIVTALGRQVGEWGRAAVASWDAFWFSAAAPTLLGLIRIAAGLMLVYTHAVWSLELEAFFGPDGWLGPEAMRSLQEDQFAWSFWWWVPAEWMWPVHWLCVAVLVLFTLGLATRVTSLLAFAIAVSYIHRVQPAQFGLDQINIMLTLYLAIGPSGAALSLDRWLARRRDSGLPAVPPRSVGANLALRLIQLHMCVIYLFAGLAKLKGVSWWNGEAMWMTFANSEYQTADMTWLAHYPYLVYLMTHFIVAWEISFWALIWRPLLRPLVLIGAVAMHAGIGVCLGMWTFGLIMLVGCAAFIPERWVNSLFARPARPAG